MTLPNGFRVRQIRRLLDSGRQVPFITTDPHKPVAEAAGAMFSRWSQENFFKYMRDEFNLDALPTHELEPLAPDTMVVNPLRRAYDKAIRRLDHQLARLRNRVAEAAGKKQPTAKLKSEVRDLEGAREIVQPQDGAQALPETSTKPKSSTPCPRASASSSTSSA